MIGFKTWPFASGHGILLGIFSHFGVCLWRAIDHVLEKNQIMKCPSSSQLPRPIKACHLNNERTYAGREFAQDLADRCAGTLLQNNNMACFLI